jgi:hypothetical protein
MKPIAWLRSHRHWLLITLTFLLLPLLQDLFTNWIAGLFIQQPTRLFMLMLSGVVTALIVWGVYYYLSRQPPAQVVPMERRPARHPGLIALVGKRNKDFMPVHEVALRYHLSNAEAGGQALQRCWLVASGGPGGTVGEAEDIRLRYGDRCRISIVDLNDAFDVKEVIACINRLYADLEAEGEEGRDGAEGDVPLRPDQIIADFTGGTSPMSVGLALACHQRSPLEYIYGGKVKEIASVPVMVTPAY